MTTIIIIIIAYILYVGYRSSSKKRKMHGQWRLTKATIAGKTGPVEKARFLFLDDGEILLDGNPTSHSWRMERGNPKIHWIVNMQLGDLFVSNFDGDVTELDDDHFVVQGLLNVTNNADDSNSEEEMTMYFKR